MLHVVQQVRYGIYFGIAFGILIVLSIIGLLIRCIAPHLLRKESRKHLETISNRFRFKYYSSPVSAAEEIIIALFCFTSFVIFCYLTHQVTTFQDQPFSGISYRQLFEKTWLIVVEIVFSWIFLFDYILHLHMSGNRFRYIWSFPSIALLLSILPGLYCMLSGFYFYGFQHLRVIRTYQSLKFLQVYRKTQKLFDVEKGFAGQIILLAFTIAALTIAAAGFEFVVENQTVNPNGLIHGFFNSTYFIIVTIATVGYGDIVPRTVFGKLVIIGFILLSIILVPYRASQLIEIFRTARDKARKKFHGHPHIVVIVHNPNVITPFIEEFYHEDRQETRIKVCLLVSVGKEIPTTVTRFLQTPPNSLRADLLQGNPLVDFDLERVKMKKAKACFILADKFAENPRDEDAKIVLETYAIRHCHHDIPIHAQTIEIQTSETLDVHPISLSDFKLYTLSRSILCPGFLTLIGNLVKAYKPSDRSFLTRSNDWRSEYLYSLGNEVYVSNPLGNFAGISFFDAVNTIVHETEALCIGIMSRNSRNTDIFLNPGMNYVIKREDRAIVIAQDKSVVDKISRLETDLLEIKSRIFICRPSTIKRRVLEFPLAVEKRLLENSTLKTAHGMLKDHVVIIGNNFAVATRLANILCRFSCEFPIVIVSTDYPSEEAWGNINRSSIVYFMKMHHADDHYVEKIAAKDANSILILRESENSHDPVVDAANIMLFRKISLVQERTIIELVHSSNSRYLGPHSLNQFTTTENIVKNAYYRAGQVYFSAVETYFSVSNYFSPGVAELIQQLLSGSVSFFSVHKDFPQFAGTDYFVFMKEMQSRGFLPIALLRNSEEGRYLVINPFHSLHLRVDDVVLVLPASHM